MAKKKGRREGDREKGTVCNMPPCRPTDMRLLAEMPAEARSGKTQLTLKCDLLVNHLSLWSSESLQLFFCQDQIFAPATHRTAKQP